MNHKHRGSLWTISEARPVNVVPVQGCLVFTVLCIVCMSVKVFLNYYCMFHLTFVTVGFYQNDHLEGAFKVRQRLENSGTFLCYSPLSKIQDKRPLKQHILSSNTTLIV